MARALILQDIAISILLLTGCFILGLIVNHARNPPLPFAYLDARSRLDLAVEGLGGPASSKISLGVGVDKTEMRKISSSNSALILDARSQVFFKLGHIPSALSLPR
jgi:predicted sulfurtransferase